MFRRDFVKTIFASLLDTKLLRRELVFPPNCYGVWAKDKYLKSNNYKDLELGDIIRLSIGQYGIPQVSYNGQFAGIIDNFKATWVSIIPAYTKDFDEKQREALKLHKEMKVEHYKYGFLFATMRG